VAEHAYKMVKEKKDGLDSGTGGVRRGCVRFA